MIRYQDALDVLNETGFTNVTEGIYQDVAGLVKDGVTSVLDVCEADIGPLSPYVTSDGKLYSLSCNDTNWDIVSDLVNGNCMGSDNTVLSFAVNVTTFSACYADQSFWSSNETVEWANVDALIETDKGVLCQCYETLSDVYDDYFFVISVTAISVAAFFGLVFLACCYMMCCSKYGDDQDSERLEYNGGFAKPNTMYMARP